MVLANPATLLFKDLPRSRCLTTTPTQCTLYVKSCQVLTWPDYQQVRVQEEAFDLPSCFAKEPGLLHMGVLHYCIGFSPLFLCTSICTETLGLDAWSYCDHSFKLDSPFAICQPAPVKVFIVVWNACSASNDSQLFHCVGIKLKLGHFHMPLNCRRWVVLLNVFSIFEGSLLQDFGFGPGRHC